MDSSPVRPDRISRSSPGRRQGGDDSDAVAGPLEQQEEQGIEVTDDKENGGDAEDVEPLQLKKDPMLPSEAEVEQHRITHWPFRSWCRECVEGRALGEKRQCHKPEGRRRIPIVGLDYFYVTSKGLLERHELEFPATAEGETALNESRLTGETAKCIMMRCFESKIIWAHVIPVKGIDEERHVVKLVCDDIEWLGHTRVIVKADNERSLQKLVSETLVALRLSPANELETVSSERPETYESQSNGGVEVGIRNLRSWFITLRACLQRRLGREISAVHPACAWLLEHVCLLSNVMRRGDDGHTSWARARGRPFAQQLLGFGEVCLYKLPTKGPQHNAEGNMAARWAQGLFVGYSRSSNSYLIATDDGVKTSRELMRRPFPNRWDAAKVQAIKVTPWDQRPAPEAPEVVMKEHP